MQFRKLVDKYQQQQAKKINEAQNTWRRLAERDMVGANAAAEPARASTAQVLAIADMPLGRVKMSRYLVTKSTEESWFTFVFFGPPLLAEGTR